MTDRLRRLVAGGTPSTWDAAVPLGAVLAAAMLAAVFARGSVLGDMPVMSPRADLLFVLFAACQGALVAAPFALILLRLPQLARPLAERRGAGLLPGLYVIAIGGFAGPLLLRAGLRDMPAFLLEWEPSAWTLPQIAGAVVSGLPPGMNAGSAGSSGAWLIASAAMPWALFLGAWLGSWPLARARPVHVGWPLALAVAALALGANTLNWRQVPREWPVGGRLAMAALVAALVPLATWWIVRALARRWPLEAAAPSPRILPLAVATAGAAIACGALWLQYTGTRGVLSALREPPRVGEIAPDFSLLDLAGKRVTQSQLRGRPALIAFWASWCGPCRSEFPHLGRLAAADEVAVIAISRDSDRAALDEFLATQELKPRVLIDDGSAAAAYDVNGIPVTWLVDADGRVLWRQLGFREDRSGELHDAVRAASR